MSDTLKQWENLVEKKWEYWEYYRELYDFSLSKAANSAFTKWIYPVFYQERLLKREFVENMQMLGELTSEEIEKYEQIRGKKYLSYIYNYYKKPTGGFFGYFSSNLFGFSFVMLPLLALLSKKTFAWYVVPPLMATLFGYMVIYKTLHLEFPKVVDMTQWAIEQRKARVWLEEKNHPTAKMAPLVILQSQVRELAKH